MKGLAFKDKEHCDNVRNCLGINVLTGDIEGHQQKWRNHVLYVPRDSFSKINIKYTERKSGVEVWGDCVRSKEQFVQFQSGHNGPIPSKKEKQMFKVYIEGGRLL
jgi:hypothetical protein